MTQSFSRLLVTTDFSDESQAGVELGGELATRLGSEVVLLYVVEDRLPPIIGSGKKATRNHVLDEHQSIAERNLTEFASHHLPGVRVEAKVGRGVPHEVIVDVARREGADLIVMATHGYGFVGQMVFGSTAERVVHHAQCPVLTVRSRQ